MENARNWVGMDVGEDWNSFVPVIDSVEMPVMSLGRARAWGSSTLCGSLLTADVYCGTAGAEGAVGSLRVREREDEREETTLRTRSRRLLVDVDEANVR